MNHDNEQQWWYENLPDDPVKKPGPPDSETAACPEPGLAPPTSGG